MYYTGLCYPESSQIRVALTVQSDTSKYNYNSSLSIGLDKNGGLDRCPFNFMKASSYSFVFLYCSDEGFHFVYDVR